MAGNFAPFSTVFESYGENASLTATEPTNDTTTLASSVLGMVVNG